VTTLTPPTAAEIAAGLAADHPFYPFYKLLVDFKQRHVQPPSVFYVTRDDNVVITMAAPIVATTVNLSVRFMSAQGEVLVWFEQYVVGPTAGTPVVKTITGAEGYLLSASVFTPGAPRGQCFVSLAVKRGGGSADVTMGDIFLQGYPGQVGGLAYPMTPIWSALDGRGRMRSIAIANPAAGADWTETVPAGVAWILRAATATLTTAVAVATRQVDLQVTDATPNLLLSSPGGTSEAASLADAYSWFNGGGSASVALSVTGGLPAEFRCPAGWIIKATTANIQAGDQWSKVVLTVEEFVGG
jgi:hypothetical protein